MTARVLLSWEANGTTFTVLADDEDGQEASVPAGATARDEVRFQLALLSLQLLGPRSVDATRWLL